MYHPLSVAGSGQISILLTIYYTALKVVCSFKFHFNAQIYDIAFTPEK